MTTLVLLAHPYPDRSRANRVLVDALADLPDLEVRSLYDLYPEFAIDADAERAALTRASLVVWQHPLFWYSPPALLKLWFEKVLVPGWAWGKGGDELRGKRCLWVITTGGAEGDYTSSGIHGHRLSDFSVAVRQTAEFCGMTWLPPFVVKQARQLDDDALAAVAERYRSYLRELTEEGAP